MKGGCPVLGGAGLTGEGPLAETAPGCLIRVGQSAICKLMLSTIVRINTIWLLNLKVPWFLVSSGFISVCPAVSPELGTGGSQSQCNPSWTLQHSGDT